MKSVKVPNLHSDRTMRSIERKVRNSEKDDESIFDVSTLLSSMSSRTLGSLEASRNGNVWYQGEEDGSSELNIILLQMLIISTYDPRCGTFETSATMVSSSSLDER